MKVLIVGGGFAGLKLARKLNNKPGFEVTLLDKVNYHQFQPLFYQVATAGLDASNISFPLRKVFHKSKNVRFRLGVLHEIVADQNKVTTSIGDIEYDILVLATGADTNFFGNEELAKNAQPMKSTAEALQLRHRLIENFEHAVIAKDENLKKQLLTIVVVGGGPTGVELGGALAEMKRYTLPKDYPEIDFHDMNIYLIEGSPRTLAAMSEKSSADSRQYLERLGVNVITNTVVKNYDGNTVTLMNGETIDTAMVIWAAGIKGNLPKGVDPELIVRGNRLKVDRQSKVIGMNNIYALGDIASMSTELYPNGHPQVASAAIQQADLLADNLQRIESRSSPNNLVNFEYNDKGSMATVGRNLAVVDIPKPKIHFKGFFAWLIWMGLHLMLILGVKNRLFVFLNWFYNYFTYDQSLRLLFKNTYKEINNRELKLESGELNLRS
ncbi:NAD(P)/FAD-dependent oxidoreductase [Gynurincola endophyticus]|jgi:NADH dehydrogenase|uniref:NAD(P)/FAD-dependent oxidoreductase n=1 Tax=Gynurincola endophyticus TaxID=2479004 RepID=UPI000F8EEF37|nr:NAD(P)/FAD-dependent oxidoreductase [Gynurincola endophyticus]